MKKNMYEQLERDIGYEETIPEGLVVDQNINQADVEGASEEA